MSLVKTTGKYIRIANTDEVWAQTLKVASTSMHRQLAQPRSYTELRSGDHVRMVVRDPRERMVSAYRWFTGPHNSYIPGIPGEMLDKNTQFGEWLSLALRYDNDHWLPQTTLHPRWREFELIDIADLSKMGWGHEKKTRVNQTWEDYFSDDMLQAFNSRYAEDLEMWKEVTSGTDTGTRRVL